MSALADVLSALRDVSYNAGQDQPRGRSGQYGTREDHNPTDLAYAAQLAAARRYRANRSIDVWLRTGQAAAGVSDAENQAFVDKLDALIARNALVGDLSVYVAYDGGALASLLSDAGKLTDAGYTLGTRLQADARSEATGEAYIARVLAPAGMNAYLWPTSDGGVLLSRGLTLTVQTVDHARKTLSLVPTSDVGTKLAGLLSTLRDLNWLYSDDEPRDDHGRWTDGGGSGSRRDFHVPAGKVDGKHTAADGSPLPAHIQALTLPPAWTDVTYNPNPGAALLATGVDKVGKRQSVYAPAFMAEGAQANVWTGAYFGPVVDQAGNIVPPADDADPDDEEMDQTPPFVLAMLGYDPKDIEQ